MLTPDAVREVFDNVKINEGFGKFEAFLSNAFLRGGISVKEMSRLLRLPVPVVSAIKNECKRRGVVDKLKSGINLTPDGNDYVRNFMGYGSVEPEKILRITDSPVIETDSFQDEIKTLNRIYERRPTVDTTLDQSLCTAETGIKRIIYMIKTCGFIGKEIIFLGDDDLTCIAAALMSKRLGVSAAALAVLDIDERILSYINESSSELEAQIETVRCDLRNEFPKNHFGKYDAVFTDPPYTVPGISLFVKRGVNALKDGPGNLIYLSCSSSGPEMRLEAQKMFCDSGLVIMQILERFNEYHGAQILGGVSDMHLLSTANETILPNDDIIDKIIYTNELNRTMRSYYCGSCGKKYSVGHSKQYATVEKLKEAGCESCGNNNFELNERVKRL